MSGKSRIEAVYEKAKGKGAEGLYADWAARYDADNAAMGFRLPYIAAAYAARHFAPDAAPLLDAGCGTGLVGATLQVLGLAQITGLDLSPEMLARARATGAYADLKEARLGERLDYADGAFANATCIGAFGPGHAPATTLNELARVTRPGGKVIFNVVEASWRTQGFPEVIAALNTAGIWTQLEDSGPFRAYTLEEPDLLTRLFVFQIKER